MNLYTKNMLILWRLLIRCQIPEMSPRNPTGSQNRSQAWSEKIEKFKINYSTQKKICREPKLDKDSKYVIRFQHFLQILELWPLYEKFITICEQLISAKMGQVEAINLKLVILNSLSKVTLETPFRAL